MKIEKTCMICDGKEWTIVDHLRAEPENMIVCNGCGFITFDRFASDSEYQSYYDNNYRGTKVVNLSNVLTTNRKIGYHERFLGEWLRKRKEEKKPLRVGEIGSSIGYFLRWVRDVHNADSVHGTELTTHHRRYAKHVFNIDLKTEFDYSGTYDLICIYHTLEHIPDADQVLQKLHKCLAPDGILYVACPVWMDEMHKFGGGSFTTFDDHFHKDHINAWSKWHLTALFEKTGWKITKEHPAMYGWTVMLESTQPKPIGKPLKEPKDVLVQLSDMQRSVTAYRRGDFQEAIRLYPKFVDAYLAESGGMVKNLTRQMELLELGERCCPNTRLFNAHRGLLFYQYGRLDESENELKKCLECKPHDENMLFHIAMIYQHRGDFLAKTDMEKAKSMYKTSITIFDKIIGINQSLYSECFQQIARMFSVVPLDEDKSRNGHFECPHAEGAPHIDTTKEKVQTA